MELGKPKEEKKEERITLPDGTSITKDEMKEQIAHNIALEIRQARKEMSSTGDWIKHAARRAVDTLFDLDEYYDQMLKIQAAMAANAGVKKKTLKQILEPKDDGKK